MSFHLLPNETLFIIYEYLLPRDLLRFRVLSKYYLSVMNRFLISFKKTTFIYDLICPMCGNDWISQKDDLYGYLDIDDYMHEYEVSLRDTFISSQFPFSKTITKRCHLLCEDCEESEIGIPTVYDFRLIYSKSNYTIIKDNTLGFTWYCLIKTSILGKVFWNQLNVNQFLEEQDRENIMYSDDDENFYSDEEY